MKGHSVLNLIGVKIAVFVCLFCPGVTLRQPVSKYYSLQAHGAVYRWEYIFSRNRMKLSPSPQFWKIRDSPFPIREIFLHLGHSKLIQHVCIWWPKHDVSIHINICKILPFDSPYTLLSIDISHIIHCGDRFIYEYKRLVY